MRHSYKITSELYAQALAIATGAAAGWEDVSCYVTEQGGAQIPCMIVERFEVNYFGNKILHAVAFPIGEMLCVLSLPFPRRGNRL